eukprot:scpid59511/ scgid20083/ Protein jagunal homolog 1
MASRKAKTESGTDGSDFSHRERVATHYTQSVKLKSGLMKVLYCHFALAAGALLHIILSLGSEAPLWPWWEVAWISTALSCFMAISSLPKNQINLLSSFAWFNVLFGIGTCGVGLYSCLATRNWILAAFCTIASCLHLVEAKYSKNLTSAWKVRR